MEKGQQSEQVTNLLGNEEILWKDRKRYLGLPISFTVYILDNNRLYVKKGLFNTIMDEMLLYRILDVKLTRTLGQKIFGVGSIMITSADQSNPQLLIKNIKKSDRTRRLLSNIVERERNEKRIMGKEMFGASGMGMMDGGDMQDSGIAGGMS